MAEDNSKAAVRSGIWYVISNVLIRSVGIITVPLYTRLLGMTTSETGFANNFNNYVSIFYVMAGLCLIYSVGRAKLDYEGKDFDGYMSAIQALSTIFSTAVFALVLIFMRPEGMLGYNRLIVCILFAYMILYPSIDYMQYKLRFEYRYRENIAISVALTLLTVALSVAFILWMPDDKGFAKILGTVLPSAAIALFCHVMILAKGKKLVDISMWRYALAIGLPMIPHGLAMILLARIDVSMISEMCDYSAVGLYTSGYTIGSLLMFITNAVGNAWIPLFNERLRDEDRGSIRRDSRILMEAGCFMTLCFVAVAPEIIKLLYSKPYHDAMWVVAPVALGTLCQYFYTNYVNVELFYKKTFLIAVNSCIAAAVNAGLNYVFIPMYGYVAAAYTTLAGYFILMILHYICSVFILKQKVYDDRACFLMLLLTICCGIAICRLSDMVAVRYASSGIIIAALALFWRKDIVLFFQWVKSRK